MDFWEAVVLIVAIVVIGRVMSGGRWNKETRRWEKYSPENPYVRGQGLAGQPSEGPQLRKEIAALKDRVATLEKLAVDPGRQLADEIDKLRTLPRTPTGKDDRPFDLKGLGVEGKGERPYPVAMPLVFSDLADEWDAALDVDDRYRALIEFGRRLPPMDPALKTAATKVPGCSADVWVYPLEEGGVLHFQADSNADITRGVVAAIVSLVDGQTPAAILALPIEGKLEALGLKRHLSANRTQGVPNMIARVREAAERLAA